MYETHTPGFCFHRDGQYRKPRINPESSNHKIIKKIYPYILTHEEIDPEKVICLHLLTLQSLEVPSYLSTKKTIDQAIFKSFEEEEFNHDMILPLYKLESHFHKGNRFNEHFKELRLINKMIELLISMIVKSLKEINEKKYARIIELANSKTEIFKLLKSAKLRKLFDLCEKSTVLTDLRYYKAVNILPNISPAYKTMMKIKIPLKYSASERFIGRIRNQLLQELHTVCQKNYKNQDNLGIENDKRSLKLGDHQYNEGFLQKIEFLEKPLKVPGGFKNNNSRYSKILDETKTLYKIHNLNDSALQMVTQKTSSNTTKEDKEISYILLKKMNNSQRIRVGKRVAELKSRRIAHGLKEKKISLDLIFQEVLTKSSLEDLLLSLCEEESKTLLKPFESKAADRESKNMTEINKTLKNTVQKNSSFGKYENNSNFLFAKIKQDIISKETNKKISLFLSK